MGKLIKDSSKRQEKDELDMFASLGKEADMSHGSKKIVGPTILTMCAGILKVPVMAYGATRTMLTNHQRCAMLGDALHVILVGH